MRRGRGWLVALIAVLFTACAPRAPQRTVVEFWQPFEAARYDSLVARFERENPTLAVHVRTIAANEMRDSLAASLAGGALPDLCLLDSTTLPELMERGELSDWSAGVADLRDSLAGWELCRVGDAIYGMPWLLDTRVLFCDEAAFARAGLDPAVALADWPGIERAVAKLGRPGGPHGWGLARDEVFASAWSCMMATEEPDSVRGGDFVPEPSGLQRLVRMRRVAFVASQDSLETAFVRGELPLLLAGPRLAVRLSGRRNPPRWSARMLPVTDSALVAQGSGFSLASLTRSAHKEAALRFARYLASPERVSRERDGFPEYLPSYRGAWLENAATPALASQLLFTRFGPASTHDVQVREAWSRGLAAALFEGRDAREALAAIGAELTALSGERP